MELYFEQIPENVDFSEYPPDTLFVLDDSRPPRDPITFKRILPPPKPIVTPEQAWEEYNQTH